MERLASNTRKSGLHTGNLRAWGMLFAIAGIVSRSILQNRMLGVGLRSMQELMELMRSDDTAMIIATVALVLQAVETVAVPIFVFLLAEGFIHTSDWKKYMARVAGLAILTEIPYDLAMNNKILEFGSQNPVIGLVLCMVLLYLFRRFAGKKLICVIMALAGLAWALMLKVDHGIPMILMICVIHQADVYGLLRHGRGCPVYRYLSVLPDCPHGLPGHPLLQRRGGQLQPPGELPVLPGDPAGYRTDCKICILTKKSSGLLVGAFAIGTSNQ